MVATRWPHVKYKEFKVGQGQMWVSESSFYQPGGEGVGRPKQKPGAPRTRRVGGRGAGTGQGDTSAHLQGSEGWAGAGGGRTCLL